MQHPLHDETVVHPEAVCTMQQMEATSLLLMEVLILSLCAAAVRLVASRGVLLNKSQCLVLHLQLRIVATSYWP